MRRIFWLVILCFILESGQEIKSVQRDNLSCDEFYMALNELIRIKEPKVKLIVNETMPVFKSIQGNYPSIDTMSEIPPPPPPPGELYYDKSFFDNLIYSNKIDSSEAAYMYRSIDSLKVYLIDSSKTNLHLIPYSKFVKVFKKYKGNMDKAYDVIKKLYGSSCFIRVSTPIFNSNCTKVIMSIDHCCGSLVGGGVLYIMGKKDGKWILINERGRWVS